MNIEYEATFINIDKTRMREILKEKGGELVYPEFLQKRVVFNLPKERKIEGGWIRIRDEGNKITMSLKIINGDKIENQKEICLRVDNFKEAEELLIFLGCDKKAYQENKRELWRINDVEVTIDEWPFLEPFVEVEGNSEEEVKQVSEKLGFLYQDALFCSVDTLYSKKYNIPKEVINNETPKIVFDMENHFEKMSNNKK
jgi:adenylate cyclase, class 2